MNSTYTLGPVTMDENGIRRVKRFYHLFGEAFDLSWQDITHWAVSGDVLHSRANPEGVVLQWILELDHPGGTVVVRWGRSQERFQDFVKALNDHFPDGIRPPKVGQSYDSRMPHQMAWLAGSDFCKPPPPPDNASQP